MQKDKKARKEGKERKVLDARALKAEMSAEGHSAMQIKHRVRLRLDKRDAEVQANLRKGHKPLLKSALSRC